MGPSPEVALSNVGVILPAGGKGLRVGGIEPKQFLPLGSAGGISAAKPMLMYAVESFHRLARVKSIVLALPPDRIAAFSKLLSAFPKVKIVEGGAERWESVRNGFQALDASISTILVHDVARPFVTESVIQRCLDAAAPDICVIAAMPAADTIKEVNQDLITKTLDRRCLILVQTPQVFSRFILEKIYATPWTGNIPTDEAQMAERAGMEVRWVLGSESNRKVTGAEDLLWAEWMASRQAAGEPFPNA